MPSVEIFGVDYSGAQGDQSTWLAYGTFSGNDLRLEECRAISREELTGKLARQVNPAIAALDFPFGVPQEFARKWVKGAVQMPAVWAKAAGTDLPDFIARREQFMDGRGKEPKRQGDLLYPECFSPLHQVQPNMLPMTFYGMRMLAALKRKGWAVPPLDSGVWESRVLLEAMPGATLKALGLPHKGYKSGAEALKKRRKILAGLPAAAGLEVTLTSNDHGQCLASHDALDSVVAAVTAALWARDPQAFQRPDPEQPEEWQAAQLEGWLYAPAPAAKGCLTRRKALSWDRPAQIPPAMPGQVRRAPCASSVFTPARMASPTLRSGLTSSSPRSLPA